MLVRSKGCGSTKHPPYKSIATPRFAQTSIAWVIQKARRRGEIAAIPWGHLGRTTSSSLNEGGASLISGIKTVITRRMPFLSGWPRRAGEGGCACAWIFSNGFGGPCKATDIAVSACP